MKTLKSFVVLALIAGAAAVSSGCKTNNNGENSSAEHASGARPYPMQKCVVSGEAFEHGKPYVFVRNGQEVKLCCKDCLAEFNKDPDKYMAKIDAAR